MCVDVTAFARGAARRARKRLGAGRACAWRAVLAGATGFALAVYAARPGAVAAVLLWVGALALARRARGHYAAARRLSRLAGRRRRP